MVLASHLYKQELPEWVPAIHSHHEGDSSTEVAFHAYGYFSAWKCCVDGIGDFGFFFQQPSCHYVSAGHAEMLDKRPLPANKSSPWCM